MLRKCPSTESQPLANQKNLTQRSLKGEPSQKQVHRGSSKKSGLLAGVPDCPISQQSILFYYLGFPVRLGLKKSLCYKGNSSD